MMHGKRINGRYAVERLIGGGGMANVYLAYDPILERKVAIKILRGEYAGQEEFVKRFQREAQSISSLLHPNIVEVYDVGDEDGMYYIVMEYVEGPTLKEYIAEHGKLHASEAVKIMLELTSALGHAHEMGIVHRDIKPQNILVARNGSVKVTDFGIAQASTHTTITQTQSFMGSVHYISPEQARGGHASKRSDVYSLGIVFYELLSGNVPYAGENVVSIALKHLQNEVPSILAQRPGISVAIANVITRATAKDHDRRYPDASSMNTDLHTVLDPAREDEPALVFNDDLERTKAIPILKPEQMNARVDEEQTMIVRPASVKRNELADEVRVKEAQPTSTPKPMPKTKQKTGPRQLLDRFKGLSWQKKALYSASAVFLLSLVVFLSATLMPVLFNGKEVEVPDVKNIPFEEAVRQLTTAGLEVKETRETFADDVPKDMVIRTEPEAGRSVKEGSGVVIYRSKGARLDLVENVIGSDWNAVKGSLQQSYARVEEQYVDSDAPAGQIVDQLPKSGTEANVKETTLKVWISKGPQTFNIPNITGWTIDSVRNYASEKGLNLQTEEIFSETVAQGLIIRQKPEAGSSLKKGDSLRVVVSKGPDVPLFDTVTINVLIPFDSETTGGEGQLIEVYVEDRARSMDTPSETFTITSEQSLTISLELEKGQTGRYRILRDGVEIVNKAVRN
ncbi:MAG: Stk1 family PASTA domain-containing Ser/Thr kinase [Bacilli bacterium]